jgi:cytoskeletal protein RodZ
MLLRCLAALWIALGCLAVTAAEPVPESTPQPDSSVSASTPAAASAAASAEGKPTPAAPASVPTTNASTNETKTGKTTTNDDFKPSEEISEDMAVAYPVDI